MKKPVTAKGGSAKPKAAQPGNRPGRGKAAHAKKAPAKPAHVPASVRAARHATAVKAAKTRAANAKKVKQHPRRQLALGEGVACCSAEALAASLRLSGRAVSDADVLALYWHTARDEHAGASIVATLEAAARWGLAGVHLVAAAPVPVLSVPVNLERPGPDGAVPVVSGAEEHPVTGAATGEHALDGDARLAGVAPGALLRQCLPCHQASVILGLDLPQGPHAVLDTGSEWITWGEPWPAWAFPDAAIEEAWEVTWPDTR